MLDPKSFALLLMNVSASVPATLDPSPDWGAVLQAFVNVSNAKTGSMLLLGEPGKGPRFTALHQTLPPFQNPNTQDIFPGNGRVRLPTDVMNHRKTIFRREILELIFDANKVAEYSIVDAIGIPIPYVNRIVAIAYCEAPVSRGDSPSPYSIDDLAQVDQLARFLGDIMGPLQSRRGFEGA